MISGRGTHCPTSLHTESSCGGNLASNMYISGVKMAQNVKADNQLRQMSSGAVPPLPHTSPHRGASACTQLWIHSKPSSVMTDTK